MVDCDVELAFVDAYSGVATPIDVADVIVNDGWTPWAAGSNALLRLTSTAACVAAETCNPLDASACDGYEFEAVEAEFLYLNDDFRGVARGALSAWSQGVFGLQVDGDVRDDEGNQWFGYTPRLDMVPQKFTETGWGGRVTAAEVGPSPCNSEDELIDQLTRWVCTPDTIFTRPVANELDVDDWTGGRGGCAIDFVDGIVGFEGALPAPRVVGRAGCQRSYRGGRARAPADVPRWARTSESPICAYDTEVIVGPNCSIAYAEAFDPATGAVLDSDCDGMGDFVERCIVGTCFDGTCEFPHNRGSHDTDGDGWWDSWEVCDPLPDVAPAAEIEPSWFSSPLVRDGLVEVVFEADRDEANVRGVVATASRYGVTVPVDPPPTWEPFVLSAVDYVGAGNLPATDTRADVRADFATISLATNNMVRLVWFKDETGTSAANGDGIQILLDPTDETAPDVLVHEFGHTIGLQHGGVRIDEFGAPTFTSTRTYSSVYRSVMSYADRMDAHEVPSFSPGARPTVDERSVTEVSFALSDYRSEWFQSGFDIDHAATLTADAIDAATGQPVVGADCRNPGFACPEDYSCVYEPPSWAEYATAARERPSLTDATSQRPAPGQCRLVTADHDWDDDGVLDSTLAYRLPGSSDAPGWNIDSDCLFAWDNNSEGKWLLAEHGGPCISGSDAMLPAGSPGDFVLPFELCANDGDGRTEFGAVREGSSVAGFDRLEYDLDGVGPRERCVWIADNADFWVDRMHEDINDFDHMWFPNGGYAVPACGGTLKFEAPTLVTPVDRAVDAECDFVPR